MPANSAPRHRRILLVDDDAMLHVDFRRILEIGGDGFALVSALNGQAGLRELRCATDADEPFPVAFVDMHMGPGWDGLRTANALWERDPRLHIVLCTAHAGDDWDSHLARVPDPDRLLVLKKPFEMIEVLQLARSLAAKWHLERAAERQHAALAASVERLEASARDLRGATRELQAFAHSVAHDLRAPLARINAFGQLLAEATAKPTLAARAPHYLQRIRANAADGEALIDGLLSLTRVAQAPMEPEPVDIGAMARNIFAKLRNADETREVELRIATGLHVWGDRQLLRLAITHLAENAWKFTARRPRTEIELALEHEDAEHSTFVMRDNGCGFDMEHLGPLFQHIHRLHDAGEYPGAGVGLVTVARVLARHGGSIRAEAAPDAGSAFHFTLPRRPVRTHAAAAEAALA